MDEISTRAVVIGVNIFVTIAIITILVTMFFQMTEIYGVVNRVDTSIHEMFDDVYSMYDGKVETGIGLLNAIKKYEDNNDTTIQIKYPKSQELRNEIEKYNKTAIDSNKKREATELKKLMEQNKTYKGEMFRYENKYNVIVTEGKNGIVTIEFIRINK